jgi:peptidoglycan/xylan/chitin deacetylase (PgdA/CDA1 family)
MERALQRFGHILEGFQCSATFPIVGLVLGRNPHMIKEYQDLGIEFASHGYRHIDFCQLSQEEQSVELLQAKELFEGMGIAVQGFRGPYLHANQDTLTVLQQQGLSYDASQALTWDVFDGHRTPAYAHVLDFYGALSARAYPSLPSLEGNLVRIPCSLPDDEALVNRLSLVGTAQMKAPWMAILHRSYELGELFTLALHPERISVCEEPLAAILSEARELDPPVWIARLDEIALWWRAREQTLVKIQEIAEARYRVTIAGPSGTVALVRGVELDAATRPWAEGYQQVQATAFTVHTPVRPLIGLSPAAAPTLCSFLQQQGYVVQVSEQDRGYVCYLDQTAFAREDQRWLLDHVERTAHHLVRLGRWPNGARSALAITGDIDALTLWDYGLRWLGR